ncbi:hypothetical protein ACF0H5_003767 [Mactra antiquata]
MKTVCFFVFLSVLGVIKGDALLNLMMQQGKIHLPADYQVVAEIYTPGPSQLLGIEGYHEYTLRVDGKTCDLNTVVTVEYHGFLMALPRPVFKTTEDTCGLSVN